MYQPTAKPKPTTVICTIQCSANSITEIHLAMNRHKISGQVDALKSINKIMYNSNQTINSLNYARNFLISVVEIDQRLN